MKWSIYALSLCMVLLSGLCAEATDAGVSVKAGTLGVGADVTFGLNEEFNVRVGGNWFSYSYDDFEFDEDEDPELAAAIDKVEMSIDFLSVGALVDWHPGGGGFRVSAGAFFNGNEGSLSVASGSMITVNDTEYQLEGLDGTIDFTAIAPYVGIGWGNAADTDSHWHFAADLGVLIQGGPDVSVTALASDPALQDALNDDIAVEIQELEDDIDRFFVYPVLALGVSYTF